MTVTGLYCFPVEGAIFSIDTNKQSTQGFLPREPEKEKSFLLKGEMLEKTVRWWENEIVNLWNDVNNSANNISSKQANTYAKKLDYLFAKANVEERVIDDFINELSGYLATHGMLSNG